ncbi:enoyl-CoA hydratase [Methylopila jiangsuensis]|uniref:Enoyl-CoA hydratase n=1 Tax=Methylopila jiangsuensis TaxID=586230 RepID=A0A9W6JIX9_9HYPH|nr:crotonase/enoyl-CoA hydratase family protein [Methylopila jiangsuensis]MDR6287092.1 DSF synthase [Methylopila jiangsuensis]GLK76579.1 enoyl-CoA hydratase [Methylopila jiangsuensis]
MAPLSLARPQSLFGVDGARLGLGRRSTAAPAPDDAAPAAPPRFDTFPELEVSYDAAQGVCWCWMRPEGAPSFTPNLLADLKRCATDIHFAFDQSPPDAPAPVTHMVLGSRAPQIFNLGGDLGRFAGWIRTRDREALRAYAYACIDVLHDNAIGFGHDVTTIALVQGDALGGGFETALSCHLIVAERGVKFGLPEILFNLFPGMGASSLLARRVGLAQAERLMTSGQLYTAEDLHALGLVHVLAEPGEGVAETHRLISRNTRRRNGFSAMVRASQRVWPLPFEELRDVTDIWVDAALRLDPADLRKMERLVAAQDKRLAAHAAVAAGG